MPAIGFLFLAACTKSPTAMSVCEQLTAGGVAANCRADSPEGLGVAAVEKAAFDLSNGKTGQILRFDADDKYDRTVDSFAKAGMLAGPHRA